MFTGQFLLPFGITGVLVGAGTFGNAIALKPKLFF
jgi:hypothetical protein